MSLRYLPVLALSLCLAPALSCSRKGETESPDEAVTAKKLEGDLTPVETPANLLVLARAHNLGQLLDELSRQANVTIDWRQALRDNDAPAADSIDFARSVDVAMVGARLEPNNKPTVLTALSVAVTSVEAAEAMMAATEMGPSPDAPRTYTGSDRRCEIAAARDAAARIVCSFGSNATAGLNAISPYLRRGIELGSDEPSATVTFYADPVRSMFEAELGQAEASARAGVAMLNTMIPDSELRIAAATAASAIIGEAFALIDDIDSLGMNLQTTAEPIGVGLNVHAQFRGRKSFTVQSLERWQGAAGPAPELFWNQAANVVGASYSRSVPAPESAAIYANIEALLRGSMRLLPGNTKKKTAVVDAIVATLDPTAASEVVNVSPARPPASTEASPNTIAGSFVAPTIMAYAPAPKGSVAAVLTAIIDLYNDKSTRRELAKAWPDVPFDQLWQHLVLTSDKMPKAAGLPANARAFAMNMTADDDDDDAKPSEPLTFGMVTADAPGHACFGFAAGPPAALAADVANCIAPTGPTLATRSDLADFRNTSAISAGFMDTGRLVRDVLERTLSPLADSDTKYQALLDAVRTSAPATTAATATRTSMTMNDLRVSVDMTLPAAATADLAGLMTTLIEQGKAIDTAEDAEDAEDAPATGATPTTE